MAAITSPTDARAKVNGNGNGNGNAVTTGKANGVLAVPRTNGKTNGRAHNIKPTFVRDAHPIDFPWKIKWNPETCIRCGSCVATCTFGAIAPRLQRQGQTL